MTMTAPERIALLKKISEKLDLQETINTTNLNLVVSEQPVETPKKTRGRPRKNVVAETEKQMESFDFDTISDDAGVLLPKDSDVDEELVVMGTYLDRE